MTKEELHALAERYGTPLYVFDCDSLKTRTENIRKKLGPDTGLCFAMKANPFLTAAMADLTDRIEVCSPGELKICMQEGINPSKILLSGVLKTREDVLEALEYGVRLFTAESPAQMELLDTITREKEILIHVFPRLTAGSQFGMDFSDLAEILRHREEYPFCRFRGIHYFPGTQRKTGRHQEKDFRRIEDALAKLKEIADFEPEELEYGPGLFFPYFEDDPDEGLSAVDTLREVLQRFQGNARVTVEMGRYFTSECGYYLTTIRDAKYSEGNSYLILDGGIHHLNYFGSMMGLRVPRLWHIPREDRSGADPAGALCAESVPKEVQTYCLCGALCTTADVLIRSVSLSSPQPGDLLIFRNTGAYSVTESNALFLSRDLPLVLTSDNGQIQIARERMGTFQWNHGSSGAPPQNSSATPERSSPL